MYRRVIVTATLVVLMLMSFAAFHSTTKATPALATAATQPCVPAKVQGVVIAQGLRVRETPSSTAKQVGLLNPGDIVAIVGRNTTGTWLMVTTPGGTTGWVGSAYVSLLKGHLDQVEVTDTSANAAEGATEVANVVRGAVSVQVVNVRSGPDTSTDSVAKLIADDIVTVIGRNSTGTWLQIQTKNDVTGWVGSPYIVLLTGTIDSLPVTDQSSNAAATEEPVSTEQATMSATEATTEPTMAATQALPFCGAQGTAGVTLKGIVAAASLRIHTKPSSTAPLVGAPLTANTAVTIEARNGSGTWLKVKTKSGVEGWVGSAYITVTGGGRLSDLPILDATDTGA